MSVQIDNMSTAFIGNADVGTAVLGSSSVLASSTSFVNNYLATITAIIRNTISSFTITGIKTFNNALTIPSGIGIGTTSIGTTNATTVDIAPFSGAGTFTYNGLLQPIEKPTSTSWCLPIVIAPSFASGGTIPYTVIQSGTGTVASAGTQITFATTFTVGCVPRIWVCAIAPVSVNCGAFNVNNASFFANSTAGSSTISWFALGY